jgi:inner membrane protein
MPSPVAHSLAGLAVAHFGLRYRARSCFFWVCALIFAANAPDLDFLAGFFVGDPDRFHHGPSHTLFAAGVFGVAAAVLARAAGFVPWRRFGFLMGVSYCSHIVFDLLTRVTTGETYGMTILWPFSSQPLMTPFHLFLDIRRDGKTSSFLLSLLQWHNAKAVVLELAVMAGGWTAYRLIRSLISARQRLP